MWSVVRRCRGLLALIVLLGVSPVLPALDGSGLVRAVQAGPAGQPAEPQDRAEKADDLDRAQRNGGSSPNRLVVVYAGAVPRDHPDRLRARRRAGGRVLLADVALQQDVIRLAGDDADAVAREIRAYPGVLAALPDSVVRADLATNDPRLGEAYALARIRAPVAWDTAQGYGVRVAVVDSGIHAGHPDLAGKVAQAQNFSTSPTTDDLSDHGTRVAGTIAATANNGIGAAGVAPGATLLSAKVLGDAGTGFSSDVNRGIAWAVDQGARVINLSLSSAGGCGPDRQHAVDYAWHAGAVVVASAGNGAAVGATAPASCRNTIGVAASDADDRAAGFSNYGAEVDLAAPGVDVLAPVNPGVNGGSEYARGSGTSLAAAHVSGVAALVWSTSYGTAPAAVRERLFNGADDVAGTGTLWARGRVNAAGAVAGASAVAPPSATPTPIGGAPTPTPTASPPVGVSAEQEEPPDEVLQVAVSTICPERFALSTSGGSLKLAYCTDAGRRLDVVNEDITRAVVVIHGSSRNADDYYDYVRTSASAIGVATTTIVVAPQYLYEEDINAHKTGSNPLSDLAFWDGGWREGESSLDTTKNDRTATISSFAAADQLIGRLADPAYFPNLQTIVITGHSAGGQYTNRFAAASGAEPPQITRRYVVMNPSSWLYFSRERRVGTTLDQFATPAPTEEQQCPAFNRYKFGLENLTPYPYVATVGPEQLKARYASRNVIYLLGELDNADTNSLDTGCEAELQGDYRLDRGNRYYNFVGHFFGTSVYSRHLKEIVPGVAHDGAAMYNSAAGRRYLFDHGVAMTPTPTATATLTATASPTGSPTATATLTATASPTGSPTATPTTTSTATPDGSPTATQLPTNTPSPTATATATPIPATPTSTATVAAAPAAPTGLTASGLTTESSLRQITLAWSDVSANEDGFKIERSTDGTSFSQIATVGVSAQSYVDTSGLSAHQWYHYRVRAHNSAGDSAYSNTARARMSK